MAQTATPQTRGRTGRGGQPTMRVWAPTAERVEVVHAQERTLLTPAPGGWWESSRRPAPGERYAFSLDGGPPRPDPRSLSQPDGPHAPSAWVDLQAYAWGDQDWGGTRLESALIYELHVGTFTPQGTLDSAIERLDHLLDLGVTLVEVMPVATFAGARGWGYDGVDLYATHAAYGGPVALQRFVDACHRRGLGVCLDVVYNHLGPSGNYLSEFGPYFTDRHQTPWGSAINLDGPHSDEVRRYLIDNALMWLEDFHLDALRLDAVHALVDDRALHVLEELSAEVEACAERLGRPLTLIAESDRNDPATVTERGDRGGQGLQGQWADDVHHSLHVLLTGETAGYYADFADTDAVRKVLQDTPFFHDGTFSSFRGRCHGRVVDPARTPGRRFIASLQNHDQIGNRAAGERLSQLVSPGRLAIGAALLLTSPYTPMVFMGEEWGAGTPWQYFTDHDDPELAAAVSRGRTAEFATHGWGEAVPDPQDPATFARSRLNWDERDDGWHAAMFGWYRALVRLRREHPDLRAAELGTGLVSRVRGLLTVRRGGLVVLANLGTESAPLPPGRVLLNWGAHASTQQEHSTHARLARVVVPEDVTIVQTADV